MSDNLGVMAGERSQQCNTRKPPFSTTPVGNVPKTFPLFPLLPPELQLQVWEHALANCFRTGVDTILVRDTTTHPSQGYAMETVVKQVLMERPWMRLMLACRMSSCVAGRERMDVKERWRNRLEGR